MSNALQIFKKILIEKFCFPFNIRLMLASSISHADANSKLVLNLALALVFMLSPNFIKNSSDIIQKSNNTVLNHRHICRIKFLMLSLPEF